MQLTSPQLLSSFSSYSPTAPSWFFPVTNLTRIALTFCSISSCSPLHLHCPFQWSHSAYRWLSRSPIASTRFATETVGKTETLDESTLTSIAFVKFNCWKPLKILNKVLWFNFLGGFFRCLVTHSSRHLIIDTSSSLLQVHRMSYMICLLEATCRFDSKTHKKLSQL